MDEETRSAFEKLYFGRVGLPYSFISVTNDWEDDDFHIRLDSYHQDFTSSINKLKLMDKVMEEKFLLIINPNTIYTKMNMNMLDMFVASNYIAKNVINFDGLVTENDEDRNFLRSFYVRHYLKYPVIHVRFQYLKWLNQKHFLGELKLVLLSTFSAHDYLMNSGRLTNEDKSLFKKYRHTKNLTANDIENSLLFLSKILYKHFRKQVLVSIQNYDTPILSTLGNINVNAEFAAKHLRNLFTKTFAISNPYVNRGIITGYCYIADVGISLINDTTTNKTARFKIFSSTDETNITKFFLPTIREKQHWFVDVEMRNYFSSARLHIPFLFPIKYLNVPTIHAVIKFILEGKSIDVRFVEGISTKNLKQLEELTFDKKKCTDSHVYLLLQLLCYLGCFSYTKRDTEGSIYRVALPEEERWELYFDSFWSKLAIPQKDDDDDE